VPWEEVVASSGKPRLASQFGLAPPPSLCAFVPLYKLTKFEYLPMIQQPIKRPRLALSCVVCRRRKVRCGREHPQCVNCTRMNETCVYNTGVRDELTGRVRHVFLNNESNHSESRPSNHAAVPDTGAWPGTQAPGILGTPGSGAKYPTASPLDPRLACSTNRVADLVYNDEASTGTNNEPDANSNPSATSESSSAYKPVPICNDYLNLERNGHSRFIGRAFWGSIAGKVKAPKLVWHLICKSS
jgi:hypothetical protein